MTLSEIDLGHASEHVQLGGRIVVGLSLHLHHLDTVLLALAAGRLLLPSLSVGYINSLTVGVKKKKTV